jgi:hypothetical protein
MALSEIETGELYEWKNPSKDIDIEGVLKSYKEQTTPKGVGNVYDVRTKNGVVPFFAPQLLHEKLQDATIGDVVQITYTKLDKTNSGNDLKLFKILRGEANEDNLKMVGLDPKMEEIEGGEIDPEEIPFD